jgi:hypothetical protein
LIDADYAFTRDDIICAIDVLIFRAHISQKDLSKKCNDIAELLALTWEWLGRYAAQLDFLTLFPHAHDMFTNTLQR